VERKELAAWLRWIGCALDRATLFQLQSKAPHPLDLLEAENSELMRRFQLNGRQIARLRQQPSLAEIDRQISAIERHQIALLPASSPEFPANLFKMRVPPPAIFIRGRLKDFDALSVGIVGPRMATPYGLEVTRRLAQDFAPTLTIVSGAALGIDTAAHKAALQAGGRTIGVLACGLDVDYPAGNRPIRERIAHGEAGALISIFPPGAKPLRHHFPARNEVLAGLSQAIIIVEASEKSGALVTARAAGEEGRQVYAVPGDITRRNSRGSNALLRDGAAVCTSADDILADLEITLRDEMDRLSQRRAEFQPQPRQAEDFPERRENHPSPDKNQKLLLHEIEHHPVSHDDLIARFVPGEMTVGDLSTALLTLEMTGRIQQQPGRIYAPKL